MLAKHPEFRAQVLAGLPTAKQLPAVRVVAFSGRETDVPHGIWGEIARQIGKFEAFKDYYSPLKAPGRTAWINLLKGEATLVLLDELPPYLDNAKAVAIGNSDLSKVTATALKNPSLRPSPRATLATSAWSSPTWSAPTRRPAPKSRACSSNSKTRPSATP